MFGLRSIVINIALIAAAILGILHVILTLAFDLELWNFHCQLSVVCLLVVSIHSEFGQDGLVAIDTEGFWYQKARLVPVRSRMLRPSVKNYCFVCTCEVCIKIECIAVQDSSLSHCVRELQVYCFKVCYCASLEIKLFAEGLRRKRFFRVISVKNWLLELLGYGFCV